MKYHPTTSEDRSIHSCYEKPQLKVGMKAGSHQRDGRHAINVQMGVNKQFEGFHGALVCTYE